MGHKSREKITWNYSRSSMIGLAPTESRLKSCEWVEWIKNSHFNYKFDFCIGRYSVMLVWIKGCESVGNVLSQKKTNNNYVLISDPLKVLNPKVY